LPSQILVLNSAPIALATDLSETLNPFVDELSKSIENNLDVQIKPNGTTYHKPYPPHFDFLKAPDGWRIPDFLQIYWCR
jgi:hypothetical protein